MKEIPLTQGKVALVDDEDYEYLNQWKWSAAKTDYTYYAKRHSTNSDNTHYLNRKIIFMHRVIMKTPKGMQCDHAFHHGLDNRKFIEIDGVFKQNLRNCTSSQNQTNRKPYGIIKYKGVSFNNNSNRVRAYIRFNNKYKHLGCFSSKIAAAKAYDKQAKEYYGEFAKLNFE